MTLPHQHRGVIALRQHLDVWAGRNDARGANKTISSGPPGRAVSAVKMVESIWRP